MGRGWRRRADPDGSGSAGVRRGEKGFCGESTRIESRLLGRRTHLWLGVSRGGL